MTHFLHPTTNCWHRISPPPPQSELSQSGLPNNTTAVVGLSGQNVLDPLRRWTPGFKQNVWASRVNATRSLVEVIRAAPVKPNVFVSISGVGQFRDGYGELVRGQVSSGTGVGRNRNGGLRFWKTRSFVNMFSWWQLCAII